MLKGFWRLLKILLWVAGIASLLLLGYFAYLFYHAQRIPASWVEAALERVVPRELVVELDSFAFGFREGIVIGGLRVYERARPEPRPLLAGADLVVLDPVARTLLVRGARYPRLPDTYYAPENNDRNAAVEAKFPRIPHYALTLIKPEILGVAPLKVVADVFVSPRSISFEHVHLDWNTENGAPMSLDGSCRIDLDRQEIAGEVHGEAIQKDIRPMLVALDVPVSLPYVDAFTEVPGPVPASCSWHVNLVNNDFTMDLGLHPTLGKYRGVPMAKADGNLHLFVYTRDNWLNYRHKFGPIIGVGPKGEPLEGTVTVEGTNGYNTVSVTAKSALPVAHLLKIGGFEDEYVDDSVFGDSECELEFRFPRSMTNNYEVLNGKGHLGIRNGRLMRMKGLRGLVELLADRVPGVSWFTDSTQGSCDYVIENGVLRSDNIYIEGSVFSIKMYGQFDTVKNALDFTVRVQFTKHDTVVGKLLHPLAWPFTKLLLEFRLTGTADNPKWEYISVIDRVLEAVK
jgi:hypothetical protein